MDKKIKDRIQETIWFIYVVAMLIMAITALISIFIYPTITYDLGWLLGIWFLLGFVFLFVLNGVIHPQ
jgi:thiol:disulfide interchange protein